MKNKQEELMRKLHQKSFFGQIPYTFPSKLVNRTFVKIFLNSMVFSSKKYLLKPLPDVADKRCKKDAIFHLFLNI